MCIFYTFQNIKIVLLARHSATTFSKNKHQISRRSQKTFFCNSASPFLRTFRCMSSSAMFRYVNFRHCRWNHQFSVVLLRRLLTAILSQYAAVCSICDCAGFTMPSCYRFHFRSTCWAGFVGMQEFDFASCLSRHCSIYWLTRAVSLCRKAKVRRSLRSSSLSSLSPTMNP